MAENEAPTDIIALLDYYHISYAMSGNVAMVSCLFHSGDNTPSMAVYPDTNSFYCFGCSQSGTCETLVMKMEGCSYSEAVRMLYGVGYEWQKLRKDTNKEIKIDESYLYNIIGRNLHKEIRSSVGNTGELTRLKQLVQKYSTTQVQAKELYNVLREIKNK